MRWLVVLVLLLAGCDAVSVRVVDPNLEGDCQRAKDLLAAGQPLEEPRPPLPDGVTDVRTRTKRSDEDVPLLIVAGKADDDVAGLRERFMKLVSDRGWQNTSNSSGSSNGEMYRFSTSYRGPWVDGTATLLACKDGNILTITQENPPQPPPEASKPLPACEELVPRFPRAVYADPKLLNETGARQGERSCQFQNRKGDNSTVLVTMNRPPVDPMGWRDRMANLRNGPKKFTQSYCPEVEASECAKDWVALVATAKNNDYWIGVSYENNRGAAERNLTAAKTVLTALM